HFLADGDRIIKKACALLESPGFSQSLSTMEKTAGAALQSGGFQVDPCGLGLDLRGSGLRSAGGSLLFEIKRADPAGNDTIVMK
ncbi:MAG: hypothetical protein GXP54_05440, partial [Deltaproteobacteria bacterium]|nr:hypothetical protein [Deltaproteobacteria bacterium]